MAGNQSESEALVQWGTGRRGVEAMLSTMGPEICKIAAPNVRGDFEVWKTRALVEIANRDELKDIISSREGVFSVYKALAKAATMGLQLGGTYPHAYFMPKAGKAVLVPTDTGLSFSAAHGPGAVLVRMPELGKAYANDKFSIDQVSGRVEHVVNPLGERGKLVLYYMRLEYRDGHVEVPTIRRDEVERVSEAYSTKEFGNGKKAPAWAKSAEAMFDKIAAKQLLKKPARESEGLAMLLSLDDYEAPEYRQPSPDVEDRMGARLDEAARNVTPQAEDEEEPEAEAPVDGKGGLF